MSFRELARVARGAGGKAGLDAFLLTYLQRKVKRAAATRRFGQLPVILHGYVKGGCAYCNTIEGAIDRRHTFRKCPRHEEGLLVADALPVFAHNFFLPPVEDGTARGTGTCCVSFTSSLTHALHCISRVCCAST